MPESFFILSKDHLEIAKDEIIAIAKTYDRFAKIKIFFKFSNYTIKFNQLGKNCKRATFVKYCQAKFCEKCLDCS